MFMYARISETKHTRKKLKLLVGAFLVFKRKDIGLNIIG
jgi:hypothetical protein